MLRIKRKQFSIDSDDLDMYQKNYKKQKRDASRKRRRIALGTLATVGTAAALGYANKDKLKGAYNKFVGAGTKNVPAVNPYAKVTAKRGDIISASRHGGAYSHYGVVSAVDKSGRPTEIINYTNPTALDPRGARVMTLNLHDFGEGGKITVESPNGKFTPDQIVDRARATMTGSGFGAYSATRNNCEHFAREMANGEHVSTQVRGSKIGQTINGLRNVGTAISAMKSFSLPTNPNAMNLMKGQFQHVVSSGDGFNIRKHLSKDLGGMSNFNKNQTTYLTAGGSILGSVIGRIRAKRKAKEAAKGYGLVRGSREYDDYIESQANKGMLKGAALGAGVGFGSSKAVDFTRGKVIADKAKNQNGLDLGTNYMGIGKTMRGIRSDQDVENIKKNWSELGSYTKGLISAV